MVEPGKSEASNSNFYDYPLEEDPLEFYDREDIKPSKKNDFR